MNNKIQLIFSSLSQNEALARNVSSLFALQLNPSISEITDIKTAVSEAVTNSIVHGYKDIIGEITLTAEIIDNLFIVSIKDNGIGIDNVENAMIPHFSSKINDEHAGMGFTIMKTFMDDLKVESKKGVGTEVLMKKIIKSEKCVKDA